MCAMRSSVRRLLTVRTAIAVACLIVTGAACATVQIPFVWVDEWQEPESPPTSAYVIGTGDMLKVQVWEQDNLSTRFASAATGRYPWCFSAMCPRPG